MANIFVFLTPLILFNAFEHASGMCASLRPFSIFLCIFAKHKKGITHCWTQSPSSLTPTSGYWSFCQHTNLGPTKGVPAVQPYLTPPSCWGSSTANHCSSSCSGYEGQDLMSTIKMTVSYHVQPTRNLQSKVEMGNLTPLVPSWSWN